MSSRRNSSEDVRRLAAMLRRRIEDYDRRHRRRFAIDSNVSNIREAKRANPGVFTLRDIAKRLGTTVGDLLGEQPLGDSDLEKLREFVNFLIDRFDLMGAKAAAERADAAFFVPETEFVEREYDYPRPYHVWVVPNAKATAGEGIESEFDTEMTDVLHSIRDVYRGELRVIRVIGESMAPVLRNNDKITIDTRKTSPRNGEVVAVYHHLKGGILGYWRRDGSRVLLEKANPASSNVSLDAEGGWTLWGTATRIVDTPIEPQPQRH
jgi:Peptidase S24-like